MELCNFGIEQVWNCSSVRVCTLPAAVISTVESQALAVVESTDQPPPTLAVVVTVTLTQCTLAAVCTAAVSPQTFVPRPLATVVSRVEVSAAAV